jgi:hypothetical protein
MRKSNRRAEGRRTAKAIFETDPDEDKENADAQQTPSKDVFDFKATPGASGKKGLKDQTEAKRRTSAAAGNVSLLCRISALLNRILPRRQYKTKPPVLTKRSI